jgi:hypothetical protein
MRLLLCAALLAGNACRFLDSGEKPRAEGQPYDDRAILEMLEPDRPVETATLRIDPRGYVSYEARLRETPPADYLEQYLKSLPSRGVLTKGIGSSPHAIPPRTFGYSFFFIRPGRKVPLTLRYATYDTRDWTWLDKHRFSNAPRPLSVEGRSLILFLGRQDDPWTEQLLLPATDAVKVREFPFRRYPGAILKSVWDPDDSDLLRKEVIRYYVVRGVSAQQLGAHYAAELRRIGIADASSYAGGLIWQGASRSGLNRVGAGLLSLGVIPGSGLELAKLKPILPGVFGDLPADLKEFSVRVTFDSAEAWRGYVSAAQWARYEQLTQRGARR